MRRMWTGMNSKGTARMRSSHGPERAYAHQLRQGNDALGGSAAAPAGSVHLTGAASAGWLPGLERLHILHMEASSARHARALLRDYFLPGGGCHCGAAEVRVAR